MNVTVKRDRESVQIKIEVKIEECLIICLTLAVIAYYKA